MFVRGGGGVEVASGSLKRCVLHAMQRLGDAPLHVVYSSSNERRHLAAVCTITYVGAVSLLAFDIRSIYLQLHMLWDARSEHRVVSRGGLGSCSSTPLQRPPFCCFSHLHAHTRTRVPLAGRSEFYTWVTTSVRDACQFIPTLHVT